jgi:formamidopyrimidine-DNA glycosylase
MPELPEVETIALQLNEVLNGKSVSSIKVYRDKNFLGNKDVLIGKKVLKVSRRAKTITFGFENFDEKLMVHLKMTGQLIYVKRLKNSKTQNEESRIVGGHPTADWVNELPSNHTRVEISFEDESKLFFNDMRAFGWMKIISRTQDLNESRAQVPDVVDPEFSLEYFTNVLKRIRRPIKIVLLDQQLMGGLGNIYVNDALNMAKILPTRKADGLKSSEIKDLREAIKFVIDLGIKSGGASAANYVDTKGLGGTYQNFFLTYKQDGKPCKNCGEKIVKIKLGGRGTFYCPGCQV